MHRSRAVLAISGFDPSGGAGMAADLRGLRAAGAWGCGAIAVLTVQSTAGLVATRPLPTAFVLAQILQLLRHQEIRAIKTGALGSAANVRGIVRLLRPLVDRIPLVVDPVVLATRASAGARLADPAATRLLLELMAIATVATPNAHEAQMLLGLPVRTLGQAADAARALLRGGARAALVKGGHLALSESTDVLAVGKEVVYLRAPRRQHHPLHGAGCTLAALIAGRLASDRVPPTDAAIIQAVRWAKTRLTRAIGRAIRVGDGLHVLLP